MVDVEKALSISLGLYKRNPVFFIPHLIESILSIAVLFTMALTLVLAIGVHLINISVDDPYLLFEEIAGIGPGLIAVIISTILVSVFFISLIKAGALAGVVGMAKNGFAEEQVSLSLAFESAKRHALDILLFWAFMMLVIFSLFVAAFLPAILFAVMGVSEMLTIAFTLFAIFAIFLLFLIFYVSVMFTPQYIVTSGEGIIGSMKKSYAFVKGNIGAVAIYIAVVAVFSFIIFGFFGITSFLPELFTRNNRFFSAFLEIIFMLTQVIVGLIIAPYFEMVKTRMIIEEK